MNTRQGSYFYNHTLTSGETSIVVKLPAHQPLPSDNGRNNERETRRKDRIEKRTRSARQKNPEKSKNHKFHTEKHASKQMRNPSKSLLGRGEGKRAPTERDKARYGTPGYGTERSTRHVSRSAIPPRHPHQQIRKQRRRRCLVCRSPGRGRRRRSWKGRWWGRGHAKRGLTAPVCSGRGRHLPLRDGLRPCPAATLIFGVGTDPEGRHRPRRSGKRSPVPAAPAC